VAHLRVLLSAVAALLLAILGPPLFFFRQHPSKTTGLAVFRVFSPLSTILAIVLCTVFFCGQSSKEQVATTSSILDAGCRRFDARARLLSTIRICLAARSQGLIHSNLIWRNQGVGVEKVTAIGG
jgi:hypothetical protein